MDDQDKPEKATRLPIGRRVIFVLLLIVLYGFLGIITFVEAPTCLAPLASNPPNKPGMVQWTKGMALAVHVIVLFEFLWWVLALILLSAEIALDIAPQPATA